MITREQYHEAKDACGDALVLFRMGDYFEAFYDDALTLSQICGLTLTTRCPHDHVAGFPALLLESYLRKIIAQGFRAAVCEQQDQRRPGPSLGALNPPRSAASRSCLPASTAMLNNWKHLRRMACRGQTND